jgi:hypothetical protein
MKRMHDLGQQPGVFLISGIDSPRKFWHVQDTLGAAGARAGVPRVWFDDNWAIVSETRADARVTALLRVSHPADVRRPGLNSY